MSEADDPVLVRLHPRPSAPVAVTMPLDVIAAIEEVAAIRDMSPEALLRFYIGQGLRDDVARLLPGPPPWLRRPNAETRQALEDAQLGRELTGYDSVDDVLGE
jgi:hypothetical protein